MSVYPAFALPRPGGAVLATGTLRREGATDWQHRALDLLLVLIAVPIVGLTVALLALALKLQDPRAPVFFVQTRYGRDGKPFRMLKLRSMVPGAEAARAGLGAAATAGFKLDRDPRVTRLGRVLRKTYLDELPQFWHVLTGEMALVGPRANSADPATLPAWQRRRLAVRPGITGSWQIMRDKPRDFAERCRIDLDYIRSRSLRGDLAILFRTAGVMLIRPTGV